MNILRFMPIEEAKQAHIGGNKQPEDWNIETTINKTEQETEFDICCVYRKVKYSFVTNQNDINS